VNDDRGSYGCFGCHAGGDLIEFVVQSEGCSFPEALDRLEAGYSPSRMIVRSGLNGENAVRKHTEYARKIWQDAKPIEGTPAEVYLASRALRLENLPDLVNLRFARLTFDGSAERHPTLVAAIQTIDGEFAGIQRTYLTEAGQKLDAARVKRSLGALRGTAIRIADDQACEQHAYVVEGLEDGLSISRMFVDAPVFVAGGAGMMRYVKLPRECEIVTICADNDAPGIRAAEEAATVFRTRGLEAFIIRPDWRHKDWNEHLQFWDVRQDHPYMQEEIGWARG
jgi:phage/plasmid primase-like uncharacterized protein